MKDRMKLLLGYDGSGSADIMLKDLCRAGFPREAEAVIVSVADLWLPPDPLPDEEIVGGAIADSLVKKAIKQAELSLEKMQEQAFRAADQIRSCFPAWEIRTEACAGSPAWEIIKIADEWRPDLVIVGSQGRSTLGRLWFGSVSQKVVTEAYCSVRVARWHYENNSGRLRIIIGFDGSEDSKAAVRAVAERNWKEGSRVKLVTSIGSPLIASTKIEQSGAALSETIHPAVIHSQEDRQALEDELRATGLEATSLITRNDPKYALLTEAVKWNADSIFVGSRGLSRFKRFLMGSVSTAVVARAHCSVEVIRSRHKERE